MELSLQLLSKDPAQDVTDSYRDLEHYSEFSTNHPRGSGDETTNNGASSSSYGGKSVLSGRLTNLSALIDFLDKEDAETVHLNSPVERKGRRNGSVTVSGHGDTNGNGQRKGKGKAPLRFDEESLGASPLLSRVSLSRRNHSATGLPSLPSFSGGSLLADPLPSPSRSEPPLGLHPSQTVENTLIRSRKGAVAPTPSRALEAYDRLKQISSVSNSNDSNGSSRVLPTSNPRTIRPLRRREDVSSSTLSSILDSPTPQDWSKTKLHTSSRLGLDSRLPHGNGSGNDSSTGETGKDSIARLADQVQSEFESIVRNGRGRSPSAVRERFTPDIQVQQAANASRDYVQRREQLLSHVRMPMEQTSELRRELERTTEVDEEVESELFRWRERVKNLESPPREEDAEKVRLEMELELRRSRDEVERLKKEVGELKETLVQGMEGRRRRTATGETKISSRIGNGLVEPAEKQANENRLPFNDEAFFSVLKHLLSTLSTDYKHDLSSLENALQFVRKADSIIWKKKMGTGEDRKIFDPENLRALEDRLMVWERLVRT